MSRLNTLLATTLGLALLGAAPVLADPGKGNGHGKTCSTVIKVIRIRAAATTGAVARR